MHFRTHEHVDDRPQTELSKDVQSEIRQALHQWRAQAHAGSELAEPVDPAHDHICGDPAAAVSVVEYGCYGSASGSDEDRALRDTLRGWLDEGKISLTLRHFPVLDSYPDAWGAAQAVEAADRQGQFWEMHEALTKALAPPYPVKLDTQRILTIARELDLDSDRLRDDMETMSTAKRIFRDLDSGLRSGVNGTPTFYVQGIRQDVDDADELHARLESALSGDRAALWPPVPTRVDRHAATGREAAEELDKRSRPAASGFRILAHDYIQHGNRVLVIGEARSDAPGASFHLPYVQVWEIEAGQAKCVHTLTDTLAIAQALEESGVAREADAA